MVMMITMMMKVYKTNKCHKFVARVRFMDDEDNDNEDGDEV